MIPVSQSNYFRLFFICRFVSKAIVESLRLECGRDRITRLEGRQEF